jgi:hypothetical protein
MHLYKQRKTISSIVVTVVSMRLWNPNKSKPHEYAYNYLRLSNTQHRWTTFTYKGKETTYITKSF